MTYTTLKLRKIGNSVGVILPKEFSDALNIETGDDLHAYLEDDGIKLNVFEPDFAEAMEAYQDIAHRYRNTLRELAK